MLTQHILHTWNEPTYGQERQLVIEKRFGPSATTRADKGIKK